MPRLRIAGCATCVTASASSGTCFAISRSCSICACVHQRADPEHALLEAHVLETGKPGDVDQQLGRRQAHVERRNEALAAGEDLRAGTLEQLERLGERARFCIGKRRRLQRPDLLLEVVIITSKRRRQCGALRWFAGLLAALVAGGDCGRQTYPSQPIRLIAPFPPGGSVDIMARLIAEPLAAQLGGKIVIDNRSGASGNIGMEAAARAKPDGYTVVLNTIPLATNQALFDKLTWDPIRDFAPIGMVATAPHVLVVPTQVTAGKVDELVKLARASPGKLTYASAGVGTTFHLCGEMFKDSTNTFILHVPYRGGGPALLDTLGGQVDMSFPTLSAALPHVKAGNLRALAVTDTTRSPLLPDVPTLQEAGVKDFQFTQWLVLLAPASTPPTIVARLNDGAERGAQVQGGARQVRRQQGFDAFITTPEEAGKFIAAEVQRFSRSSRPEKSPRTDLQALHQRAAPALPGAVECADGHFRVRRLLGVVIDDAGRIGADHHRGMSVAARGALLHPVIEDGAARAQPVLELDQGVVVRRAAARHGVELLELRERLVVVHGEVYRTAARSLRAEHPAGEVALEELGQRRLRRAPEMPRHHRHAGVPAARRIVLRARR